MATDNIVKVGRSLGRTSKDIRATTNRYGENFPVVESSTDIITRLNPFRFEFYTYSDHKAIYLDIIILDKFKFGYVVEIQ